MLCLCQGLGDALVVVQHWGDGVAFSQAFPITSHHWGCFSGDALVMDYFLNDFVFVKTTLFKVRVYIINNSRDHSFTGL